MGEFVQVECEDGAFDAYLSLPNQAAGPAVLVLAEIYNVNQWVRDVTDRYAAQGYVALAPDLFWRQEPGLHMAYTPENQQKGRALAAAIDTNRAVKDLDACLAFLRKRPGSNGKVGAVGFCLGGQLAYRLAAHSDPDACSVYYGTRLQEMTGLVRQIRCQTQLHFGEADHGIPVSCAWEIEKLAADMPNIAVHVYKDAPHGFGRFGYPPYREADANLALQRTLELFGNALR